MSRQSDEKDNFLWWRDGVIYQIYPWSFMDSNGDGVGDLAGIISRLDYLAELGIDGIWLSPVNVSPMKDFGYDVSDYENIDPIFGSLEDFNALIEEAHRRGLRIIMDMLFNHTSDQHPWFLESRSSHTNPKADWYIWHDGRAGRPPNNWASAFGGSAWTWDRTRRQYYYHMFLKEQPDLNWRNPAVRSEILGIMKYWLDRGVDGFSLDVANGYIKDAEFRDNPQGGIFVTWKEWHRLFYDNPKTIIPLKTGWQRQTHVYDRDQLELDGIHRAFRQLLDSYTERYSVGEISGRHPRTAARYVGNKALHMAFSSSSPALTGYTWQPTVFRGAAREREEAFGIDRQPCYFLSNHDIPRHISRYAPLEMKFLAGQGIREADERAKVAAAALLTLRGTPFLYYGEEVGMRQVFIPPWQLRDTIGKRYWPIIKGRDGCRTPMQWNSGKNAGFTGGKPWLPIDKTYRWYNVETEKNNPASILSFYKKLIRMRKVSPALQRGSYRPLLEKHPRIMAYLRETAEQKILVALNFFPTTEKTPLNDEKLPAKKWRVLLSSVSRAGPPAQAGEWTAAVLELAPYEAVIMEAT